MDEVHVFVAPRIVGGAEAVPAVSGQGLARVDLASAWGPIAVRQMGGDIYINGRRPGA